MVEGEKKMNFRFHSNKSLENIEQGRISLAGSYPRSRISALGSPWNSRPMDFSRKFLTTDDACRAQIRRLSSQSYGDKWQNQSEPMI